MKYVPQLLIALGLALGVTSGYLTATAFGQEEPTRTVTVDVATGPAGPAGPAGPPGPRGEPGPAGSTACPAGYSAGVLVINHPGGQVSVYTCLQDG